MEKIIIAISYDGTTPSEYVVNKLVEQLITSNITENGRDIVVKTYNESDIIKNLIHPDIVANQSVREDQKERAAYESAIKIIGTRFRSVIHHYKDDQFFMSKLTWRIASDARDNKILEDALKALASTAYTYIPKNMEKYELTPEMINQIRLLYNHAI